MGALQVSTLLRARGLRLIAFAPAILCLTACAEEPPAGPGPYPAALAVLPVPLEPLAVGDTLRLAAVISNQHGSPMAGPVVAWRSDNTDVATVGPSGTVMIVGSGTARITAKAGGASGSIQLQAVDPPYVVLSVLYFVTDGENWTNSDNWFEDDDLGTWYGVDTDTAGNVVGLSLEGNNLDGRIPPELGDLVDLRHLNLSDNELGGGIPIELGHLKNLRELHLHNNDLTDGIPPYLGNLEELRELHLHNNDLNDNIPSALGNLDSLRELSIHSNDISGEIPPELGNLAQLRRLNLNHNDLTGHIPPELGRLTQLERLYLGSNELWGEIPPELGGLRSLQWLWLANNDLEGTIPSELGRLGASLRVLWLSNNDLEGKLPSRLGELGNLAWLLLGGNEELWGALPLSLTGLPLSIFAYDDTDLCALPDQEFQEWLDSIPNHTGTGLECPPLTDREILEVFYEATGGPEWVNSRNWTDRDQPLGNWWGVQTDTAGRVVRLHLDNNRLTGRIPRELGGLGSLRYLNLRYNLLTGEIPPQLGELKSLRDLILDTNALTGEIPPELGKLGNLEVFDLSSNGLTGEIPPELGELENLQHLYLHSNGLTGEIPPELELGPKQGRSCPGVC